MREAARPNARGSSQHELRPAAHAATTPFFLLLLVPVLLLAAGKERYRSQQQQQQQQDSKRRKDKLLPTTMQRSDGMNAATPPSARCCLPVTAALLVLLVLMEVAAGALAPVLSQHIINGMPVEIHLKTLSEPAADSLRMGVRATVRLPILPLPVRTGPLSLSVALADEPGAPVGVFEVRCTHRRAAVGLGWCALVHAATPCSRGYNPTESRVQRRASSQPPCTTGEISHAISGRLSVRDEASFSRLAARILLSPSLQLRLTSAKPFSLYAELPIGSRDWPKIANVTLTKRIALRGAAGLGLRVSRFEATDATPGTHPGYGGPLLLNLFVEATNPSSFAFGPMGSLLLQVQHLGCAVLASVGTLEMQLPQGRSRIEL